MNVIGVVLGGGTGSRLSPLTAGRSKPAVPLAGKYRLVDVPISSCISSQIYQIFLLTQYNSGSLHHHIQSTYQFDHFSQGYVRLLAAEQTPHSDQWFQGTADAVRQSMHHLGAAEPDIVVILSGDQLFRMNFREVIQRHVLNRADITISSTPVAEAEASGLGILKVDGDDRVTRFVEKPARNHLLCGLQEPGSTDRYLASMGIYVFQYEVLDHLLRTVDGADFGRDIIPQAITTHRVYSDRFDGYWKDIGTIESFWRANLELTGTNPAFSLYEKAAPLYTRARFLPPSRVRSSSIDDCLLSEGCTITGSTIRHSVIGLRTTVRSGSEIRDSIIMGSDYFEPHNAARSIALGVGANCRIERAIIDKNVRIGDHVTLSPHGLADTAETRFQVKDGILVIPKGTALPDGTVIGTWQGGC